MEEEELGSPHIMIALNVLHAFLSADQSNYNQQANAAHTAMVEAWTLTTPEQLDEAQTRDLIRVWRVRKPQKQGKTKVAQGNYVKLQLSLRQDLALPLKELLLHIGAVVKHGKAPRGYMEREASRLLGVVQMEN